MSNHDATSMSSPATRVFDPENGFLVKWKRLMLIVGVLSIIADPLFLYVPCVKGPTCLEIDVRAAIFFTVSRSVLDLFHFFHIFIKFRIPFQGPGPRVFKTRRNLIKDPRLIAINYIKFRFIVDLIAILPFPQMVLWSSSPFGVHPFWSMIVVFQFALRMITFVPLDVTIVQAFGVARRNVWSGAIYNLFIFILIGHFVGANYYQYYLRRLEECVYWVMDKNATQSDELDCSQIHRVCVADFKELDSGMLSDAFSNEIGLKTFIQKSVYCFVWGVRSISSLGQTFDASYDVMETIFSCLIMIFGLILLADLIAHMQTSVQSTGARRDRQRAKLRRLEEWTHYHNLPPNLKGVVRQSVQSEWQGTKGIDDEAILSSLPSDIRRDIRIHLYKERVHNIPPFSRMDEELLDFICGHLRTMVGTEGTYIVLQGDPIEQMVFIFSGLLQLSHHSGGGRSNSRSLEAGDFFGEELLTWASQSNALSQDLPPSACSVKCLSNVEAFCLPAEDVRILAVFNYTQRFHLALRHHLA